MSFLPMVVAAVRLLDPTAVSVEGAGFTNEMVRTDRTWRAHGVTVAIDETGDIRVSSPKVGLCAVCLKWKTAFPGAALVYRDAWERTGNNSGWYPVRESAPIALPWYTLVDDGKKTDGYGVAVQPNAFACWSVRTDGLALRLDLRAGTEPVELGGRELVACRLVQRDGKPGERAFLAARAFARAMCPVPRLPKEPVFGYNDWYCAYGKNTASNFLADAAYVTSCAKGLSVRPYVVMDDGWQPMNPWEIEDLTGRFDSGRGSWTGSAKRFGMEMPAFTKAVAALGAKPGLWYRPFRAHDESPAEMKLKDDDRYFDLSVPAVEALVRDDVKRFRSWGMKLVKIDYLAGDVTRGKMAEVRDRAAVTPLVGSIVWRDRSRTSAEVVCGLYRAMREAAGDDMVIIGCNAFNHFVAGLFELQRTGDDTSGRNWRGTKEHGVSTLGMRAHQDGIFFSVDADCAGLVEPGAVPWEKNRQWIDLLGRSGTATFVSWFRDFATDEVRAAIAAAYAHAAAAPATAEPLDWQETPYPRRWKAADGVTRTYDWDDKTDFWFVVNEDNDHFFKCDSSLMTVAGLSDYIDYIAQGGKVTHLFMCVNGQRASYDSKTWEPIWAGMDEPSRKDTAQAPDGTHDLWCVNAKKLRDAGIDPYAIWIRRCREKAISPWVSMRMNDVHFCNISNYFRNATFPRTRRDLWLNPASDCAEWAECQLDYAKKEVRDYAFAQAEEMAERWESDGLELDWMRFGYALKPGRYLEDAHFIDGFVRDVRAMLDRVGAKRGKRLGLAVRVPRDPEIARDHGFDAVKWAKNGWVDVVVGHSFLFIDTGLSVGKWLKALEGTKARFLPGIDQAAPAAFGLPNHTTQVTEYRGTAEIFERQGATGVYLFNLVYSSKRMYQSDGESEYMRGQDIAGTLYCEGLSPADIAGKDKAYLPVYHDYPFPRMEPGADDWRILAADRGQKRLMVLAGSPKGTGRVLKTFEPLKDPRVAKDDWNAFNDIDEAKAIDGGKTLIGCASSDAFFGFDYETEKLLFYGRLRTNLHSIDRLPDGRLVVACSTTSDRLVLVDLNGHPFEPRQQKYIPFAHLRGAHGVIWDHERNCLFALGYPVIVRYAYDSKTMTMTETGRWNYLLKDGDHYGHDFTPDGHGGYYFTVHQSVRHFDPETGEFRRYRTAQDAKSFHHSDVKGDLYSYATKLYWAECATIDAFGKRREVPLPEGSLVYKFRWMIP